MVQDVQRQHFDSLLLVLKVRVTKQHIATWKIKICRNWNEIPLGIHQDTTLNSAELHTPVFTSVGGGGELSIYQCRGGAQYLPV